MTHARSCAAVAGLLGVFGVFGLAGLLGFSGLSGLAATSAHAADPAPSQAKSWGLVGEEPARFEAKVVDALCALTGDCPEDCGGGARQMALIRSDDGRMIMPMKNIQPAFSGAVVDLAPYCGQTVEVDGLLVGDPAQTPAKFYQVQTVRTAEGEPVKANLFTKAWAKAYPEATGKGPWFRRDPRILEEIQQSGYLGLGLDVDKAFIEENF